MPRVRRGRRKRSPSSHVGGPGSKATSRGHVGRLGSKASSRSHVGGLGSRAGSRSRSIGRFGGGTSQPFRPIRRPRYRRPYGYTYPRRYRARPMSSGGCFTAFIIFAIIWLIYLAPMITISLGSTLSLALPIVVIGVVFFVAIGFITKLVDNDEDEMSSDGEQVKIVEHETILVICPYCGAKNEQGITSCTNCGAEI